MAAKQARKPTPAAPAKRPPRLRLVSPTPDAPAPQLLTVRETCHALAIGATSLWKMVRAGELRVVRLGRSTRVPATEVERIVAGVEPVAVKPPVARPPRKPSPRPPRRPRAA